MNNQHAIDNAKGWLVSIREMVNQYDNAEEGEAIDNAEQIIFESPLSVLVRSGWYSPGDALSGPAEYAILLTTGGPGLRITGDLSDCEPANATLQWQDWGVPWTDFHMGDLPEGMSTNDADAALLAYACHFYFEA